MAKTRITATLALVFSVGTANAGLYDVTLYWDGEAQPSSTLTNIFDGTVIATGSLFIEDELLVPGAFLSWSDDRDAVYVKLDYDDGFSAFSLDSRTDFILQPSNTGVAGNPEGSQYGLQVMPDGQTVYFDQPGLSSSTGGPTIYSGPFTAPFVTFVQNDFLDLGYSEDRVEYANGNVIEIGDLINPSTFGAAYTPIANVFLASGAASSTSGYAVISPAIDADPIPLPGAFLLMGSVVAGVGTRRVMRGRAAVSV